MPLTLPQPPSTYDPLHEARRNEALRASAAEGHSRLSDIEVGSGRRVIMTSPNGTRWALAVDNGGTLTITEL